MTDASLAEAAAATLIILCLVGAAVSTASVIGAMALDWIENKLSTGESGMLVLHKSEHVYHDQIKPKQEADYSEWLDRARDAITQLSKSRPDGIVSSDDVWDICPPPPEVEPRAMGAIWQPRGRWQKVGFVVSRRALNHKRPIMQWRYLTIEEMREAAE